MQFSKLFAFSPIKLGFREKITLNCMTKCIGCLRGYIKAWRKILCRVAYGVSFPRFGVVVWSEWGVTGPGWVCSASGALSGGTMACQATEDRHFWVPHHGEPSWKASVCVLNWMGPCWECEVESHLLLPAVVFSVRSEDLPSSPFFDVKSSMCGRSCLVKVG